MELLTGVLPLPLLQYFPLLLLLLLLRMMMMMMMGQLGRRAEAWGLPRTRG